MPKRYISDRLVNGEKHMKEVDPLLAIEYNIQGIVNQSAYGFLTIKSREKLKRLTEQRDKLLEVKISTCWQNLTGES